MRPSGSTSAVGFLFALVGCTGGAEDSGAVPLPPQDTSAWHEDTGTFPIETGDTGSGDESPAHWRTLRQEGTWLLGGAPDDPGSVTGSLVVTELLDGDEEEPACTQTWALVGTRVEAGCDGCLTFTVTHTRNDAAGDCATPELPEDGEVRTLGWSEAESTVWWDWYDTGVWVPLWATTRGEEAAEILLSWEETVGADVEDSG